MTKFLKFSALFVILVLIAVMITFFKADGYTDSFYMRVATPKQNSLIIGNSKAAQGLQPDVIDEYSKADPVFNFAFSMAHSPYGPAYLKSIKKKLSEEEQPGTFILTVDPWSISSSAVDPNNAEQFSENESFINDLSSFSTQPNIPYLVSHYKNSYAKIFQKDTTSFLHDNGWLEIKVNMKPEVIEDRILAKVADFRKKTEEYQFSETRLSYLYKTIEFLKQHGKVHLVIMPVHPQIREIEQAYMPDFGTKIREVSHKAVVPLFDLTRGSERFIFTDGIHLAKESGEEVSYKVGSWIERLERRNPNSIY
ncbi:MAG: hypothetical protein HKN48_09130 [Flavobacteriaceae bacterium]|nr:hypothetical protein [Flavobacteriaceae bacterium]